MRRFGSLDSRKFDGRLAPPSVRQANRKTEHTAKSMFSSKYNSSKTGIKGDAAHGSFRELPTKFNAKL